MLRQLGIVAFALLTLLASACSANAANSTSAVPLEASVSEPPATTTEGDPDVPQLPFPDNPDPAACGIPAPMGDYVGWVNGVYQGQVVEPTVFLYDNHERRHVTGALPSGTQVHVQLHQSNPVLDFYYVEADAPDGHQKGWVPAPFLQFDPLPS